MAQHVTVVSILDGVLTNATVFGNGVVKCQKINTDINVHLKMTEQLMWQRAPLLRDMCLRAFYMRDKGYNKIQEFMPAPLHTWTNFYDAQLRDIIGIGRQQFGKYYRVGKYFKGGQLENYLRYNF